MPGLVCMAMPSGRLVPSGRIMPQIMPVPGLVCMAVPTGRLMPSGSQIMSVPGIAISGRIIAVPLGRLGNNDTWDRVKIGAVS